MSEPTMNQYAPPLAHVADAPSTAVGELNLFSPQGRIGRLRYLAYGAGAGIIYNVAITVLTLALGVGSGVFSVAAIVAFCAVLWFSVITGIKRCHDMGISGWWSVTLIIPFIVFAWVFWPGTDGDNRFGPRPPANTWGVRLLALIFPLFMIIGILAAVAIPQYKHYTDRVRAQQQQQQQQAPVGK